MLSYNDLLNELKRRPPSEQLTLLEELVRFLREELTATSKPSKVSSDSEAPDLQAKGWPVGYFEETFGSLRDVNLERQPQGEYEVRESLD